MINMYYEQLVQQSAIVRQLLGDNYQNPVDTNPELLQSDVQL
ncbi:hypothetical protein [Peribacillus sp. NPDC096540]